MIFDREPVLSYAVIVGVLNVAVALGLDVSDEAQAAILALSLAVLSWLARRKVTPVE